MSFYFVSFSQLDQQLNQIQDPGRRALILAEIRAIEAQRLEIIREQTARYRRYNDNMERALEMAQHRLNVQALMNAKNWVVRRILFRYVYLF